MDLEGFVATVEEARRAHPVWFGLESDPPATESEIGRHEALLGVTFPAEYRQFLEIHAPLGHQV